MKMKTKRRPAKDAGNSVSLMITGGGISIRAFFAKKDAALLVRLFTHQAMKQTQ